MKVFGGESHIKITCPIYDDKKPSLYVCKERETPIAKESPSYITTPLASLADAPPSPKMRSL
jgi:hypothetical protein